MKRVLIIGGSGFIGLNIANELFKKNYKVTIFDKKKKGLNKKIYTITSNLKK